MQACISSQCQVPLALTALLLWLSTPTSPGQGTIYYGHFPPTIVPPPATSFPEDAEGTRIFPGLTGPTTYPLMLDGQLVCTFSAEQFGFAVIPTSSLDAVIAVPVGQVGGGFAIPLAAGQEIGPGAQGYYWMQGPTGYVLTANADFGPIGYFTGLESAYLGLEFQQDGHTYYGWVRLGAPFTGLNGGWLYDYAYETVPDTPILAGAGVPEPSTLTLCLVGITLLIVHGSQRFCRVTEVE
jgi:hypothetical protein